MSISAIFPTGPKVSIRSVSVGDTVSWAQGDDKLVNTSQEKALVTHRLNLEVCTLSGIQRLISSH